MAKVDMGNNAELHSDDIFTFLLKWRKQLVIITLFAIVTSTIVSLFIQNKYKSTVVLFPTTTNSISKALISENNNGKEDVLRFGEEEDAEQMIQILGSDEIRDYLTKKYNLYQHYDIDTSDVYKQTKLQKEYENNVSFEQTKFLSVKITVLDHDPDTASMIANEIAALIDTVKNRMIKEIAIPAFLIVEKKYSDQIEYVKSLEDSLTELRKLGVIDYESQAERITEQLSIAVLQGKKNAEKKLQEKLNILSKYGGAYVSIRNQLEYEKKQLTIIHTKYEEAKVDAESTLQHKFIVNKAYPAEKYYYPIRWLIVLVSTLSTIIIAIIALMFYEKIKNQKIG